MGYKRAHIRIPLQAYATLSCRQSRRVKAQAVNISAGGIGLSNDKPPLNNTEYHVQVTTNTGECFTMLASVVYRNRELAGLKTIFIDRDSMRTIKKIVARFESSNEFISHIEQQDILNDWFVDDNGQKLDFGFERPN
ncbi:PilZ domain-containing protein [Desulfopila sp. IMCC35008]|uniref:PilZ domain-containing protein n=1 Tax=Desulfopila sp. IMCC35008 TaxID=2653858 RepID=UPI0013D300B3|nr:PilZ domain-containing protein [Desulfopila sp. IMCC35008]